MAVDADSIYQLIKSYEGQFAVPAPFVTIHVGAFNAATGSFQGLTTTVVTDPEPIEHGPGQHPTNPPPHFQGDRWISVTIDSHWRRTTTSQPAPHIPLAPALLQFTVTNANSPWSVTVNGATVSAPATQTTISVSLWDAGLATWTVQAGAKSYHDSLRVQRPAGVVGAGVGAFTIPVLPVAIVYAPPVDSLGESVSKYVQGATVGTTVTTEFGKSSTSTAADTDTAYFGLGAFKGVLDTIVQVLSLNNQENASKAVGDISSQFGKFTSTIQTGISDLTDITLTVTQTTSDTISTNTTGGGPGAGDVVHFYKNLRMAWCFLNGQLRLCPLGFEEAFVTVSGLQKNASTVGVSDADVQLLLSLDPFAGGGPGATPAGDRFTLPETWEYGFGANLDHQFTTTRDTKTQSTHTSTTTTTTGWDAGPIFQAVGLGGSQETKISFSNATGTDVSTTVMLDASLVSGPQDYFVVTIWYDTVFGTFAFQQAQAAPSTRFQGSGAHAGQIVTLMAGGRVYRTVADQHGHFAFRAHSIPAGRATLRLGSGPVKEVTVAALGAHG